MRGINAVLSIWFKMSFEFLSGIRGRGSILKNMGTLDIARSTPSLQIVSL
jgi:hypothetical protein